MPKELLLLETRVLSANGIHMIVGRNRDVGVYWLSRHGNILGAAAQVHIRLKSCDVDITSY